MKSQLKRTGLLGVAVTLLLLLLAGTLLAAGETIARYNLGSSSGGGRASNDTMTVRSAFGQPIAGVVGTDSMTLCSGITCGMGVMRDAPISDLTASNDGPTILGATTNFSASSSGNNVTYTWDFGDGTSGSGPTPSHTYAAVGSYVAQVTASNGVGSQSASTVVEVSHAVVEVKNFDFAPATVTIPRGGRVTWYLTSGTHNVRADDGSFTSGAPTSTWTTYSQTFAEPGAYPYYCELHGGAGGIGMTGVVNVEASSDSAIAGLAAANDGPTLLGSPTAFTASVTDGSNIVYSWDFGDGTSAQSAAPVHTYAAAGTYVATVTASNSSGVSTAQTTVEVSHAVIEVGNFFFTPAQVTIRTGQRVTWVLVGGTHNVRADDDSFTSGPPSAAWTTFTQTFNDAGTFGYYCELHGGPGVGMFGVVTVEAGSSSNGSGTQKTYLPFVTHSP